MSIMLIIDKAGVLIYTGKCAFFNREMNYTNYSIGRSNKGRVHFPGLISRYVACPGKT